jgi:hypothetical protein
MQYDALECGSTRYGAVYDAMLIPICSQHAHRGVGSSRCPFGGASRARFVTGIGMTYCLIRGRVAGLGGEGGPLHREVQQLFA